MDENREQKQGYRFAEIRTFWIFESDKQIIGIFFYIPYKYTCKDSYVASMKEWVPLSSYFFFVCYWIKSFSDGLNTKRKKYFWEKPWR